MANTTAKLAIQLTLNGASQALGVFRGVVGGVKDIGGALGSANANLFYFLNNMKSIGGAVGRGLGSIIEPNKSFEQFTEQMAPLLNSIDLAIAKQKELFNVANDAGLGADEMKQLFLNLQRTGGSALTGAADLTLWVKAAKISGQSAAETGRQIGEFWTMLEAGEDPMRMLTGFLKSGAISGDSFKAIKEAMKAEKSAGTIFDLFKQGVGAKAGFIDRMPATFMDITQQLKNFSSEARRMTGEALFKALKEDAESISTSLRGLFDSGRVQQWANTAGAAIKGVYETLKTASLGGVTFDDLFASLDQGKTGELLKEMLTTAAENFWSVMVNQAHEWGPEIQKTLIPSRMHDMLGLNEQTDLARIAKDGARVKDVQKYQTELRSMLARGNGDWDDISNTPIDVQKRMLQEYAQSQQGFTPRELKSISPELLASVRASFAQPAPISIPTPQASADLFSADQMNEDRMRELYGNFYGTDDYNTLMKGGGASWMGEDTKKMTGNTADMSTNLEKATRAAEKLAAVLEKAVGYTQARF